MNEVLKAIQDRRSTRGFNDVQLTEGQLKALIDAALAAPSARNSQMWHFSVVQNRELLDEFSRDFASLMAKGAQGGSAADRLFYHAPTVIFISRPAECDNSFVEVDCGIACENIALAAQGLGSAVGLPKQVLSDHSAHYCGKFGFPKGHCFSIAVGNNTVTQEARTIGEGKSTSSCERKTALKRRPGGRRRARRAFAALPYGA